jgi:fibronectin-binding autotransporter adhesin
MKENVCSITTPETFATSRSDGWTKAALPLRLLAWLILLVAAATAPAATYTWTGAGLNGDTDYKWSNPMNWQGLAAPQDGEQSVQLVFPNTGAPRNTTNDVVNMVLSAVTFQGANYSIHGGASGITMTLAGPNGTSFAMLAVANGCQFGSSTRLHLGSTGTVAVASGTLLTIKSRISGVFGFNKTGPGTLSFQGLQANTFTGPLTVLNGILDFRVVGTALPGTLIIGDGDLFYSPLVRLYLDDQISDTSPVIVNANGSLDLDGHDDMIGSLTLASGAVKTGNAPFLGVLTLNGNVTNRAGFAGQPGTISGKLSLGSTTRGFGVEPDTELIVSADISATTAGLSKSGAGQLVLSGSGNTYFGPTTVQAGTLLLSGSAKPGSVDNGTVVGQGASLVLMNATIGSEALSLNGTTNQAAFAFAGTNSWAGPVVLTGEVVLESLNNTLDDRMTFSGNISGTGALRLVNYGSLYFTGLGNNTFTGGYHGERGHTYFAKTASAAALGGPLFVGRADDEFPQTFVFVETLNQIPDTVPVTLRNSGALSIENGATDTLGNVVFEGGWLDAMSGTFTLSGHVTNRLSPDNISWILGTVVLPAGEHIFAFEQLSKLDVVGVLQGPGGVTKVGNISMLRFLNTNTYAGLTHVVEGDLVLEGAGRPGSSAAGTVVDGLAGLQLRGVSVTNETLTLAPLAPWSPIIWVAETNIWKGPVVLTADADIRTIYSPHLVIDGPISGPGNLIYKGDAYGPIDGTLVLQGSADNTYLGETRVLEGTLVLNKLNAEAIPGDLVVGYETNGAPTASVYCQQISQFATVSQGTVNTLRVTLNGSGSLHCGGFMQFIANLLTRGGSVFTEGGMLYLHGDWNAETGVGASHFFGKLALASPFNNHTHVFNVASNAVLSVSGDIGQGIAVAHLEKQGKGELAMISSNSFDGVFTVRDGRVLASGQKPFGTALGLTIVSPGATVVTFSGTNAESFSLSGHGYQNQGALVVQGGTYFDGSMLLAANADIVTPGSLHVAVFSGVISGPGGITKLGEGVVRLAGASGNTYAAATRVMNGTLDLTKTNAVAVPGTLDIGTGPSNAVVRLLLPSQISDVSSVVISDGGQLHLFGNSETIGSLAGSGIVALLNGTLVTGNDNTATAYSGLISGIGGTLTKTGTNTFTLTGNNAYTGTTFAKGGTLIVNGQQPQSPVTIQTGGALAGTGSVGAISDLSGHVRPGNSCGALKCAGFITHSPANQLEIEINGTTPGVNCDQLQVTGAVTLMGGTLQLAMNFPGAISNQYVVVKNDGANPVTGTFIGLPQGSMLTNNGAVFQITYTGGDGNDIVLIQQAPAGPKAGNVEKLANGTVKITAQGQPNASYKVEAAQSLNAPIEWVAVGNATADAAGQFSFTDPDAPQYAVRFYRFVQQ